MLPKACSGIGVSVIAICRMTIGDRKGGFRNRQAVRSWTDSLYCSD